MKSISGYKTYITAAAAVLAVGGAYAGGEISLGSALATFFSAALATFVRSGSKADAIQESLVLQPFQRADHVAARAPDALRDPIDRRLQAAAVPLDDRHERLEHLQADMAQGAVALARLLAQQVMQLGRLHGRLHLQRIHGAPEAAFALPSMSAVATNGLERSGVSPLFATGEEVSNIGCGRVDAGAGHRALSRREGARRGARSAAPIARVSVCISASPGLQPGCRTMDARNRRLSGHGQPPFS